MDREQHNLMQNRMRQIRLSLHRLNKFGMPTAYYLKELAILENVVRAGRTEIETIEYQTRLEIEPESL